LITIASTTGSGSFPENSVINFSYSEDASPVDPFNLDGGAGQVTAVVEADEASRGTRLVINNEVLLSDSDYGDLSFRVSNVALNENGTASLSGETVQKRLTAERSAEPVGGTGETLLTAVQYYCGLVGIEPVIPTALQTKMDAIPVNFIGWNGEVWDYLKQLCAAVPLDSTDNTLLEMYFKDGELHFREGLKQTVDFTESLSSNQISASVYDSAQSVEIANYNTGYGVNRIVKEVKATERVFALNENVSITDSMQVEAGETLVKRFQINASLETVNQPVNVAAITSLPYTGSTGEYVIVGSDDLPIEPEQWQAEGGSVTVALTENPTEIEITITAPAAPELKHADDANFGLAPYKIGVEVAGDAEYPALYVTGTGVFYDRKTTVFPTGASNEYVADLTATAIDNIFITNKKDQLTRGVAAAQEICGPRLMLSQATVAGAAFGDTVGARISDWDSKFRITSVGFNESSVSIDAKSYVTFADFNATWTGSTFANFSSINSGLSFNEFSLIPLSKG
jgi:hypothetical protein